MRLFLATLCTLTALLQGSVSFAQTEEASRYHHPMVSRAAAKTTVADPGEDNYDVKYVKLDLQMTNASTALNGNVTTRAVATSATLAGYIFELNPVLVIDSAFIDGAALPVVGTGLVRAIAFSSPLTAGTAFTARIFYHGTPVSGTGFPATGINSLVSPSWGTRATFTLSESYHANEWWPCKQSLKDKIDSADIWLTVADSLKAGSNGLLQAVTPVDATHNRYEWKERHPIDYYLISAAVAPYVDYSFYMHYTGSTDSTLVQNYVYNNPATLPYFKAIIDSTGPMIDYFSTLFGRYPFWDEKYGHCMGRLSGGMEHQTMTTLGFFEGTLIAHELGHQWFGDNVTCATWADIVMNEGFAGYIEYLFIDHFRTHLKALSDMDARHQDVKSAAGGSVFVDDTTSETRIFDSRLTYDKGACVLHMLRSVINNDSVFFSVLKTYQQQMKDSTATIIDFANVVKSIEGPVINGIVVDQFFSDWMFGQGYPKYNMSWNQVGSDVYVKIDESVSMPSSVPFFALPIEIKLHSLTAGDTIVRVLNNTPSQIFHLTWSKSVATLAVDPNLWLVYDLIGLTHDATLDVNNIRPAAIRVLPNPTSSGWALDNVPANSTLVLMDVSGRVVWQSGNALPAITVPGANLAPGMYLLRVSNKDEANAIKLIRK